MLRLNETRFRILAVWKAIAVTLLLVGTGSPSFAVNPDEVLKDPALEARARALSVEIRCLVCQNQSIDDSDAQLARDLRVLVREQLVAGKTDQQVLDFLVERYGEFVLLKPRFTAQNIVLWVLPLLALLIGIWYLRNLFANRNTVVEGPVSELSADEKEALEKILKK